MAYIRRVRTASGAIAVQICEKVSGRVRVVEHLGSAHDDASLAVLVVLGKQKIDAGQGVFDFEVETKPRSVSDISDWTGKHTDRKNSAERVVTSSDGEVIAQSADLLWNVLVASYTRIGFSELGDEVFKQLVLARVVEGTSKQAAIRIIEELGQKAPHRNTINNCLKRVIEKEYQDKVSKTAFNYRYDGSNIGMVLYDVTTLYFEAEKEDELRKSGFSKERRIDPQIVVGLLVDSSGFPLEVHMFEGNKAETLTLIPVLEAFRARHNVKSLIVVADAGMLSDTNLTHLEDAGFGFIVGSRVSKAPKDLVDHFDTHGAVFKDGQIVEATTVMGRGGTHLRRVVYRFSQKRWAKDNDNLDKQKERALRLVTGKGTTKKVRFVKQTKSAPVFDETAFWKARQLAGLKGYVTNIDKEDLDGSGVVAAYHDLFEVERSFRMAKTDLRARPIFHRVKDSIKAHLVVVFTALAVARDLQEVTGLSVRRVVEILRPLKSSFVEINGGVIRFKARITTEAQEIIEASETLKG